MNKNFSRTITSSSTETVKRGKRNLWQWLVEPVVTVTDVSERRQASLVSAILLVLMLAMSAGSIANTFILHDLLLGGILAGSGLIMGITYALSRTRHYRVAPSLLLVGIGVLSILDTVVRTDYSAEGLLTVLIFNIMLILLGGTLVSFRTTIYLAVANMLFILLLPIIIPAIPYSNLTIPILFNGIMSALILVLTQHRNQVEKDRLSEMDTINSTLQTSNAALQTSNAALDARTRGLNLAIEVGRSISQVRALDVMLTDAAELIRKQFDLYYVQVYLTDPNQTNLILQAGTGNVGTELLRRAHRLPLNTNSINGRAAIEKKSVVISDTANSPTFKPNPLLPNTRSEMAVPLLVGDRAVGVLDMQSEHAGSLSTDILSAFEALAGQLAIAIQNANFLAETNQARAEVEAQARRLTRANWVDYLDAIHQPEETGFMFEQNKITPLTQTRAATDNTLTAPIEVTGEALGNLVVEMEGGSPIARTDELINTVARQVAQQIESLRLLDSAERYRAEAEQASRRLTREGWQDYASNANESMSYFYDLKEVLPYNKQNQKEDGLTLPLKVRDETIGKLVIQGLESSDTESMSLANAVAERLGAHIENLRLSEQSLERAQRERALRQITSAVRGSTDPATILRSAARELGTLLGRKTIVRLETARETQASRAELVREVIANNGNKPIPPAESQNAIGGDE